MIAAPVVPTHLPHEADARLNRVLARARAASSDRARDQALLMAHWYTWLIVDDERHSARGRKARRRAERRAQEARTGLDAAWTAMLRRRSNR